MSDGSGETKKEVGLKPGSVVYVGQERTEDARIHLIEYTETDLQELEDAGLERIKAGLSPKGVSWINIDGIHDADLVQQLGEELGIHALLLEDAVNTNHRPKLEESSELIAIVLKMLYPGEDDTIMVEQVTVAFGPGWVLSLQEVGEDVFGPVRERLRRTIPRVRFMSADYLAYALIDAVVDNYFVILESVGERIEALEEEMEEYPRPESLGTIRDLKRLLLTLRKAVWPLREVIGGLERTESPLVKESTQPYIRDLYEHTIQVIDTVETFRDMVSGLLDLYHTGISNRMNEIMKVLTIFASIFIPLGFLAGVYGMNFDQSYPFNMPEAGFEYGYLMFWGMALAIGGGLLVFFRRKKWL
ncbi:MAG: magnesium/cobalt transporter CorA [candidate division Zixibacteria bacterium]|nr:magnesium/cobalt transporter CorA [candidate division Zixibacteria bacterium]